MSARRAFWLLVAGIAVIAFAIWLSSRRHLERDLVAGELVLPGLEQQVNALTNVSLRRGDDTHTTLRKDPHGWQVAERDWPADLSKVRKLVLGLGALNIVEEKTRLPANYPQLGVEDVASPKAAGTLIELTAPAHRWALIVGKPSGAKSGYVRIAGTPPSLLAAPQLSVDADPKDWLAHALLDISEQRVREIEEQPAQGASYKASRDKAQDANFNVSPLPKGRALSSPGAADGLGAALSTLNLDDVRKAAPPAGARARGNRQPGGARARNFPHLRRTGGGARRAQGRSTCAGHDQRALEHPGHRRGSADAQRAPQRLGIRDTRLQVRADLHAARGSARQAAGAGHQTQGQARQGARGRRAAAVALSVATASPARGSPAYALRDR